VLQQRPAFARAAVFLARCPAAETGGYDPESMSAPAARLQAQPKAPPYSIEAEQSVLGGLMLDNRAWN
jgi:hypothetical protein